METTTSPGNELINQSYAYAADLLVNKKLSSEATMDALIAKGMPYDAANTIVDNVEQQIKEAKKERAKKDMLYGGLWCVGGIIATASNIGLIFWGAILFGGIQFFKGLANA